MNASKFVHGMIAASAAVLFLSSSAFAQTDSAAEPQTLEVAAAPAQVGGQQLPRVTPPVGVARAPYWTANAGFEADSNDSGFAFIGPFYVKPFRPNVAWVAGASLNYLFYEYATPAGHNNVRSPGVSTMGGVRFGRTNYVQLLAGPGFKRRHVERLDSAGNVLDSSNNIDVGLNLGADAYVNPTSHNNIHGMLRYGAEDQYTWGRVAYKEQITNRDWSGRYAHFLGGEVIAQGNDDIRSTQVGALYEIAHVPSSVAVTVRAGYKRSVYDIGPDKTGPWFAIGFWHRLR
jgi:hypothetical protein